MLTCVKRINVGVILGCSFTCLRVLDIGCPGTLGCEPGSAFSGVLGRPSGFGRYAVFFKFLNIIEVVALTCSAFVKIEFIESSAWGYNVPAGTILLEYFVVSCVKVFEAVMSFGIRYS